MSAYRGRFAPSPTGDLHFGSMVSALASFVRARAAGGTWLVRIEDLDPPREVPGAAARILAQLAAHGMVSDEPVVYQSDRHAAYEEALERLLESGQAFYCGCSRRDLPDSGIYPGTCEAGLPKGRVPRSVRLRVGNDPIRFEDLLQGRIEESLATSSGAFVIRRADGLFAYQLAVVVDDAWQGITEIVRGCDLLDSTARQIHLQRCLDLGGCGHLHHPVALGPDGRKLSKQLASLPVELSHPVDTLVAVWHFLGQAHPPPAARTSVRAFWDWAVDAWDHRRIPTRREIPLGPRSAPTTQD